MPMRFCSEDGKEGELGVEACRSLAIARMGYMFTHPVSLVPLIFQCAPHAQHTQVFACTKKISKSSLLPSALNHVWEDTRPRHTDRLLSPLIPTTYRALSDSESSLSD